ncbi:MAG: neutral/alkaline non-lysosomal ceramidase N-terminal domain-containing protein [Gemmatimonadaceae bacterium]
MIERAVCRSLTPRHVSAWLQWLTALGAFCAIEGCYRPLSLSAAPTGPSAPSDTFKAGFARVDITPPPGAGLVGFGTEGLAAIGHRQRLFARAMYLEDRRGERVAIVSLDLGESSIVLHRRVADSVFVKIGLGADRLLLSATHTHSGPSHFFGIPAFDELGSAVSGYDHVLTDTLVARLTRAILLAYHTRQQARAAWGLTPVWGFTRIRSFPAYQRNPSTVRASLHSRFTPDPRLPAREAGVDPTLGMLRVDLWDSVARRYRRAAAFSVFAIHGTVLGGGQSFYDADVQGRISTLMEQYMDTAGPVHAPRAVHLLVNGGEGDVSPEADPATRCPTPRLVRSGGRRGPRGASFETVWRIVPRDMVRETLCVPLALREMKRVAAGIATEARSLYDRLEGKLGDDLIIQTAVAVLRAGTVDPAGHRLCSPTEGVATVLGAEDGWTRLRWDWSLLAADSVAYAPLPSTARATGASECQGAKRNFLGRFQFIVAGRHALPDHAQLALVRLGPVALTFVPGEPTTHAAWTMRRATASVLFGPSSSADSVLMVSLTNGYVQYITTPDEYALQLFEGAATIYGPDELIVFTDAFRELAGQLAVPGTLPRPTTLDNIGGWSKPAASITRWDEHPNPSTNARPWRELSTAATANEVRVRWIGPSPSAFYTSEGPSIFFEHRFAGGWLPVAWDNLPEVEVSIERRPHGFAMYDVAWKPDPPQSSPVRVRLTYHGSQICRELTAAADTPC